MLGQGRGGAEAVVVAGGGVGEPDGAVGVGDEVAGGVEGPVEEVVEEEAGVVGRVGVHVEEAASVFEGALGAEDEAVVQVGAAFQEVVGVRDADFVASEVGRGEEFEFGEGGCSGRAGDGGRGCGGEEVGGYVEGVCGRMEYTGGVEVGGAGVVEQELEGRGWAKEGGECGGVDLEGVRAGGSGWRVVAGGGELS